MGRNLYKYICEKTAFGHKTLYKIPPKMAAARVKFPSRNVCTLSIVYRFQVSNVWLAIVDPPGFINRSVPRVAFPIIAATRHCIIVKTLCEQKSILFRLSTKQIIAIENSTPPNYYHKY